LFPVQPSGKGASTVRLGVLTEATSPVAWRTEHDESFGLPQSSRFAAVATSAVSGSQAGELMDRINHVNRLLAEVEHIYPETATATATTTTIGSSDHIGRGNMVTAQEVAEVAEGIPIVEEDGVEANTTEENNNDEKELLNLTQFVTDEITSVVDNALSAVNAAYLVSPPVKGTVVSCLFVYITNYAFVSFKVTSYHINIFYCIYSWRY